MHDKSPEFWNAALAWLSVHAPVIYGAGLSVFIAVLRVIYSGGGVRQQVIEGAMCGALTLAVVGGFDLFGLPQSAAVFVGGALGFLGVEQVRNLAEKFIGARIK